MTAEKSEDWERGSRLRTTSADSEHAVVKFLRQSAEESPDGKARLVFFVGGEVLFEMSHEPSECQAVGFNEFVFCYKKALEAAQDEFASDSSDTRLSRVFIHIFQSLAKADQDKRHAIMVRAIAMTHALFKSPEVAHFLETKPAKASDSLFFAASQARIKNDLSFDYDQLLDIADARLAEISGEYQSQKTLAAVSKVNPTVKPIVRRPSETAGELVGRMANPQLYEAPVGYRPPTEPLELLARYEGGERYFESTSLQDATMIEATLAGANLNRARLISVNMRSSDLSDAHLIASDLSRSNLSGSKCAGLRLMDASLQGTILSFANLEGAHLRDANLEGANLQYANLKDASFLRSNLSGADLSYADISNTDFEGANLESAKLQNLKGTLWLDDNSIREAQFSFNAPDPWSTLCRHYTGINLVYHFVFLFLFVLLHVANVAYLVSISKGQQLVKGAAERAEVLLPINSIPSVLSEWYLDAQLEKWSVLEVATGLAKGYGTFALTLLLIAYNAGRWHLTKEVSLLKADQERNRRSPKLAEYKKLFYIHRVVRLLMLISLALFAFHVYSWLSMPVAVPRT